MLTATILGMSLLPRALFLGCAAVLLHSSVPATHAQAAASADQRLRLHVYGLASYVRPDYVGTPNAVGLTVGGTVDGIRVLPYLQLGLDLRGATSRSDLIHESALTAGPRLSYSAYRLQPYVEYMFGVGRGSFPRSPDPNYTHDYTAIRSFGGGFDYQLTRNFGLRADAQYQRWRFTHVVPYFHPVQASIGISYRLHFRSRTGPRD